MSQHVDREHFDEKAATWDDPARTTRAAAVAERILQRVPMGPDSHVLDFGSGTGLLGFHLLPRAGSVTFADPSEGMLAQVEAKLEGLEHGTGRTHLFDPERPALPRAYDAVVSLMTLHHVHDPAATLAFLVEHLEPGGWLAVCDLDREDGSFHDEGDLRVHHGFDRDALAAKLRELGLEEVETSTAWVMTKDGPDGPREYPLFLLTARDRGSRPI